MPKYPAPLPHDTEAEDKEFHAAFADAMRKVASFSPPAQKPALELGGSGAGLVEIHQPRVLPLAAFRSAALRFSQLSNANLPIKTAMQAKPVQKMPLMAMATTGAMACATGPGI